MLIKIINENILLNNSTTRNKNCCICFIFNNLNIDQDFRNMHNLKFKYSNHKYVYTAGRTTDKYKNKLYYICG